MQARVVNEPVDRVASRVEALHEGRPVLSLDAATHRSQLAGRRSAAILKPQKHVRVDRAPACFDNSIDSQSTDRCTWIQRSLMLKGDGDVTRKPFERRGRMHFEG